MNRYNNLYSLDDPYGTLFDYRYRLEPTIEIIRYVNNVKKLSLFDRFADAYVKATPSESNNKPKEPDVIEVTPTFEMLPNCTENHKEVNLSSNSQ